MAKNTIGSTFDADHSRRQTILERVRLCASLTKPWAALPEHHNKDDRLPEVYQSEGSRGVTNLEGRMLLALYPPETPWFSLTPSPSVMYDPRADPEVLQEIQQRLWLYELMVQATLEARDLSADPERRRTGFLSQKRKALSQVIITGETLEWLTDRYTIKVIKRDKYVTRRDGEGAVLYHIVVEEIDPLTLNEDDRAKIKLSDKAVDINRPCTDRMTKMYTRAEWNPLSKTWVIQQEMNGTIFATSEEPISPLMCTTFDLAPGEDYARGFVEANLGDLRSYNELEEKILDFAALHSKQLVAKDYSSLVRDEDLAKPSGEIIQARVTGGKVQDVGVLAPTNAANFEVVFQTSQAKKKSLAAAMMLESAMQPHKERVTATQVHRIAVELEGALGGFYTPIADDQQGPLIRRTIWQMQRDKILPPLPKGAVTMKLLTGISAIAREGKADRMLDLVSVLAPLGPEALKKLDINVFTQVLMRYRGIHEPGLIKSEEDLAREAQQAVQQAIAQHAGEAAVDTAAHVVENAATAPQPTGV